MASTEIFLGQFPGLVELEEAIFRALDLFEFRVDVISKTLLVSEGLLRRCMVRLDLLGRDEEVPELLPVHRFEVRHGNLVPALFAHVLG